MFRRALVSRLRLANEEGAALILSLGVSIVVSMLAASSLEYTTSNQSGALSSRTQQIAYALAEAGLNNAMAVLANPNNNPLDSNLLVTASAAYEGGTATWSGTLDRATAVWTLTSTGEALNPGNQALPARRRASASVRLTPAPPRPVTNEAWNYVFSQRTGTTCDLSIASRVIVDSPIYSMGNICLNSGTKVTRGPVVAVRRLSLSSIDSAVGSIAAPISEVHTGLGCRYYTQVAHAVCSSVDNVFAGVNDTSVPAITPPVSGWDAWYATAAPGPSQNCAVATGMPPAFENESVGPTRNASVPGSFNLTPAASYSCRVGPVSAPIGELSWDAATRVLRVTGAIFIDGSATVANGAINTYVGRGTLYLSGTFLVNGASKLCAVATATGCDFAEGAWDPEAALLTVTAGGSGGQVAVGVGIQLSSAAQFQGAALATSAISLGSDAKTQGPLIGSTILFGAGAQTYPFPEFATAPAGMPGDAASYPVVQRPESFG